MSKNNLKLAIEIESKVSNINEAEQYIDNLEQMGLNIDHLRKRSKALVDAWDDLSPRERSQHMRRLREVMSETAAGTLDLEKETRELAKANDKASKSTKKLSKNSTRLNRTYSKLRKTVIGLGAAFAAYLSASAASRFFSNAVSGAAKLEKQLDKVQAVSGATSAEMKRIADTATALGSSTKYTATQAAEGFEILARAGLSANESITAIPSVLSLATASGLELAEASDYITKAIAGMNLSIDQSGRVADVLAKAAASANTDVAGLGQALSYAAPSASALGLSLEETVAIIGKFSDAGIDASRAGTALNSILAQFSNPASKFRQELGAMGIKTGDFSKALRKLAKSGDKGQKAILAVGQEAGPALKALLAQGIPSLDTLTQKLNNASGAAKSMADTMSDNLDGSIIGLGSAWDTLKTTLGAPIIEPLTHKVKELTAIIRDFVAAGRVEEMGIAVAAAFTKMSDAALTFIKDFDLSSLTKSVTDFGDNFTETFTTVKAVFGTTYNVLATGFNTLKSIVFGFASGLTYAYVKVAEANAKMLDLVPGMSEAAQNMRVHIGGMTAVADEFARRAGQAFDDAANSANRLRDNVAILTGTTQESTKAVDAEVQAFNNKIAKLEELKAAEAQYISAGKKNTKEYNAVVTERINLETKVAAIVGDNVLASYDLSEADSQALESKKQLTKTTSSAAQALTTETTAKKQNTRATRKNEQAKKANAQAANETAEAYDNASGSARSLAEGLNLMLESLRSEFKDIPKALEEFDQAWDAVNYEGMVTGFDQIFSNMERAYGAAKIVQEDYGKALERTKQASDNLNESMQNNTLTMSDVQAATEAASRAVDYLDESELEQLNSSIDAAKNKLQSLEEQARSVAQSVADRLADATGSESDKVSRRFDREIQNIRKQQQESGGVGRDQYAQAIADLERLKQIELNKQREREVEQSKREAEQQRRATQRTTANIQQPQFTNMAAEIKQGLQEGMAQTDMAAIVKDISKAAGTELINNLRDEAKRQR